MNGTVTMESNRTRHHPAPAGAAAAGAGGRGRGRGPGRARARGAGAAAPPNVAEAEAEHSLILLVDDHPTNRMVIARQLALAGYASEAVEDGAQGLAAWRSGRYALVLSDVHMPHMDGYQMARAIRTLEAKEGRGGHTRSSR